MFMVHPSIFDYALCNQTVTVYHEDGGSVTRTVYKRAFLDFKKTQNVEKTGLSEASGFLLVIPGATQACQVSDKVFLGIGPEVPEDVLKWWRAFIPAKVDGLVVVRYVDTKYWNGQMIHTEAGG